MYNLKGIGSSLSEGPRDAWEGTGASSYNRELGHLYAQGNPPPLFSTEFASLASRQLADSFSIGGLWSQLKLSWVGDAAGYSARSALLRSVLGTVGRGNMLGLILGQAVADEVVTSTLTASYRTRDDAGDRYRLELYESLTTRAIIILPQVAQILLCRKAPFFSGAASIVFQGLLLFAGSLIGERVARARGSKMDVTGFSASGLALRFLGTSSVMAKGKLFRRCGLDLGHQIEMLGSETSAGRLATAGNFVGAMALATWVGASLTHGKDGGGPPIISIMGIVRRREGDEDVLEVDRDCRREDAVPFGEFGTRPLDGHVFFRPVQGGWEISSLCIQGPSNAIMRVLLHKPFPMAVSYSSEDVLHLEVVERGEFRGNAERVTDNSDVLYAHLHLTRGTQAAREGEYAGVLAFSVNERGYVVHTAACDYDPRGVAQYAVAWIAHQAAEAGRPLILRGVKEGELLKWFGLHGEVDRPIANLSSPFRPPPDMESTYLPEVSKLSGDITLIPAGLPRAGPDVAFYRGMAEGASVGNWLYFVYPDADALRIGLLSNLVLDVVDRQIGRAEEGKDDVLADYLKGFREVLAGEIRRNIDAGLMGDDATIADRTAASGQCAGVLVRMIDDIAEGRDPAVVDREAWGRLEAASEALRRSLWDHVAGLSEAGVNEAGVAGYLMDRLGPALDSFSQMGGRVFTSSLVGLHQSRSQEVRRFMVGTGYLLRSLPLSFATSLVATMQAVDRHRMRVNSEAPEEMIRRVCGVAGVDTARVQGAKLLDGLIAAAKAVGDRIREIDPSHDGVVLERIGGLVDRVAGIADPVRRYEAGRRLAGHLNSGNKKCFVSAGLWNHLAGLSDGDDLLNRALGFLGVPAEADCAGVMRGNFKVATAAHDVRDENHIGRVRRGHDEAVAAGVTERQRAEGDERERARRDAAQRETAGLRDTLDGDLGRVSDALGRLAGLFGMEGCPPPGADGHIVFPDGTRAPSPTLLESGFRTALGALDRAVAVPIDNRNAFAGPLAGVKTARTAVGMAVADIDRAAEVLSRKIEEEKDVRRSADDASRTRERALQGLIDEYQRLSSEFAALPADIKDSDKGEAGRQAAAEGARADFDEALAGLMEVLERPVDGSNLGVTSGPLGRMDSAISRVRSAIAAFRVAIRRCGERVEREREVERVRKDMRDAEDEFGRQTSLARRVFARSGGIPEALAKRVAEVPGVKEQFATADRGKDTRAMEAAATGLLGLSLDLEDAIGADRAGRLRRFEETDDPSAADNGRLLSGDAVRSASGFFSGVARKTAGNGPSTMSFMDECEKALSDQRRFVDSLRRGVTALRGVDALADAHFFDLSREGPVRDMALLGEMIERGVIKDDQVAPLIREAVEYVNGFKEAYAGNRLLGLILGWRYGYNGQESHRSFSEWFELAGFRMLCDGDGVVVEDIVGRLDCRMPDAFVRGADGTVQSVHEFKACTLPNGGLDELGERLNTLVDAADRQLWSRGLGVPGSARRVLHIAVRFIRDNSRIDEGRLEELLAERLSRAEHITEARLHIYPRDVADNGLSNISNPSCTVRWQRG